MISVLDVSPAPGEINRDTPLTFDIRTDDPNVFTRVIVGILYPGSKVVELVYAQDPAGATAQIFSPFYNELSSVSVVTDAGFQRFKLTISRKATDQVVWPDSPQLQIFAFNDAGEEL